jgi:hypothetical protein
LAWLGGRLQSVAQVPRRPHLASVSATVSALAPSVKKATSRMATTPAGVRDDIGIKLSVLDQSFAHNSATNSGRQQRESRRPAGRKET